MEFFQSVNTKSSGRPVLSPNEQDIIISDSVGLYLNKERIPKKQNGRVFLTNQRVIYIDNAHPQKESVSLDLSSIESVEYQPGFLKRSSRLILFLGKKVDDKQAKINKTPSDRSLVDINDNAENDMFMTEWQCPICLDMNKSKGKIVETSNDFPVCKTCGVTMDYSMAKESISIHDMTPQTSNPDKKSNGITCPACTFLNHPSMKNCEVCGTKLPRKKKSPKPIKITLMTPTKTKQYIQISFRKSDGSLFAQATEKIVNDMKRVGVYNQNVVSINGIDVKPSEEITNIIANSNTSSSSNLQNKVEFMGINGLERFRENQLMNNDILFTNALQDLNNLMSLANSIENLYKSQDKTLKLQDIKQIKDKQTDLIIDRDKFLNQDLFLDEIAREIYDFAMLEFKDNEVNNNVLIPLIDFYAMYNKAMRIGTGLISPSELKDACDRFVKLGLKDLKLITLNKRILCLATTNSFDFIQKQILDLLSNQPGMDILKITQLLNQLANDKKIMNKNNNDDDNKNIHQTDTWTVSIIEEILQSCIDNAILVIDEQMSGIYYYKNNF